MLITRLALTAPLLLSCLVACSSSSSTAGSSSSGSGSGGAPGSGGSTTTGSIDPDGGPVTPVECASPPSPPLTKVIRTEEVPLFPLTLPVTVTGTTDGEIDFQYFEFTLTDVAKVDVVTTVLDFASSSEQTSVGVKVRNKTVDVNTSLAFSYAEPYDTMVQKGVSPWLVPGAYSVLLTRTTKGPAAKRTYVFTLGITYPPVLTESCTPPKDSVSLTDVTSSPECNAWCKRVPACDTSCAQDACAVEIGQCPASTRAYLDCLATTAKVICVDGGGWGYENSCSYDPSVCEPGTIREQ